MRRQTMHRFAAIVLLFCFIMTIWAAVLVTDDDCCHSCELCTCTLCSAIRVIERLLHLSASHPGWIGLLWFGFTIPLFLCALDFFFRQTPVRLKDKLSN